MKGKVKAILSLILMMSIYGCDTESSLDPRFEDYFIKYYGGIGDQEGIDFQILDDGFIIVGNSVSSTVSKSQVFLVRTDVLGNELWSQQFGGDKDEEATALQINQAGDIYVSVTIGAPEELKDVKVLRVDADSGDPMDSVIFGESNFDEIANNLLIADNGDIILSGYTTNVDQSKPGFDPSTDLEDIFSLRMTPDLSILGEANWRRVSGFPGIDRGVQIVQQPDGTFLFFGTTDRPRNGSLEREFNMFLFPANNLGTAISTTELQLYGSQAQEDAVQIVPTFGGGYAMIGTTTNGPADSDGYMVRIRSNTNLIEETSIDLNTIYSSSSIVEDKNGGFLMLGDDFEGANSDILLTRRSLNGDIVWERTFGGIDADLSGKVKQSDDGSVLILGTIRLESQTKVALIKTNPNGELTP